MTAVSIITPWRDHPKLIADYVRSVAGAQVILEDNASAPEHAHLLREPFRSPAANGAATRLLRSNVAFGGIPTTTCR
jgi:hypothetical protein